MIKARLRPTTLQPEHSLVAYQHLIHEGRSTIAAERRRARNRALSYARFVKHRAHASGYQDGVAAAKADCAAVIDSLRHEYAQALQVATQDCMAVAKALTEQFIDRSLLQDYRILYSWISQSLTLLGSSRHLELRYHPRYEELMVQVSRLLPETMSVKVDTTLENVDFTLKGDSGGIEFSWRTALEHTSAEGGTA